MAKLSYFNETHHMVRDTIRRFVQREVLPFINDWEEAGEFPREIFPKAAEVGIPGIGAPEKWGGTGIDVFMTVVATEELVRSTSVGFWASLCTFDIGLPPIWEWGSEAMQMRVVPPVLSGEKISALAITEPGGGSDVASIRTRAMRDGGDYVIDGGKTFITTGVRADYYTVAVRTGGSGHGGISLFLVEKETPGFTVGRNLKKMGWWVSDTAELFFEGCRVPAANLIGSENSGFYYIMSNFQMERLRLAVAANVTAEMALEESIAYARERRAFGRPLSGFQVTRHKLAKMATTVAASREFTYRIAARMANGEDCTQEVSMAKNQATLCSDRVTWDALQILGGAGYMRGTVVERLFRDNRILSIGGGTYEIMNEVIAKQLGL
jgi:acyl-CoA dehydrogenase